MTTTRSQPALRAQRVAICPTGPAPMISTRPPSANGAIKAARNAVFASPHQQASFGSMSLGTGEQIAAGRVQCEVCAMRMKIRSPTEKSVTPSPSFSTTATACTPVFFCGNEKRAAKCVPGS